MKERPERQTNRQTHRQKLTCRFSANFVSAGQKEDVQRNEDDPKIKMTTKMKSTPEMNQPQKGNGIPKVKITLKMMMRLKMKTTQTMMMTVTNKKDKTSYIS